MSVATGWYVLLFNVPYNKLTIKQVGVKRLISMSKVTP